MEYLRPIIAVAITIVWAVVVLSTVFVKDVEAPVTEVTSVMLLAATYLLGREAVERFRRPRDNGTTVDKPGGGDNAR